jgi:tellurite resistance protein TerC
MFTTLRQHWHAFRADPPGQRFQRRYSRRNAPRSGVWRKLLVIVAGFVVLAIGIVMLVLPGPGSLVMVLGAALIAEESLFASRLLDRCDLRIHGWIAKARARR